MGLGSIFTFYFGKLKKGISVTETKDRGIHVNTYNRAISLSPHLFSRHFPVQHSKENQWNPRLEYSEREWQTIIAMEEEIKAEFQKNGFNFDDEGEVLKKCNCFTTFALEFHSNFQKLILPILIICSFRSYFLHQL